MQIGGTLWYTGTDAADDDTPASGCTENTWRHKYWKIVDGNVALFATNRCFNHPLYCRRR